MGSGFYLNLPSLITARGLCACEEDLEACSGMVEGRTVIDE